MSTRTYNVPTVNAVHLEEDELQYECTIRNMTENGEPDELANHPNRAALSRAECVNYLIEGEVQAGTEMMNMGVWPDEATEEEIQREVDKCLTMSREITRSVANHHILRDDFEPQEAPMLASRLRHYELRLQRLPKTRLSAGQTLSVNHQLTITSEAYMMLNGLVRFHKNGHATLSASGTENDTREPTVEWEESNNTDGAGTPTTESSGGSTTHNSNATGGNATGTADGSGNLGGQNGDTGSGFGNPNHNSTATEAATGNNQPGQQPPNGSTPSHINNGHNETPIDPPRENTSVPDTATTTTPPRQTQGGNRAPSTPFPTPGDMMNHVQRMMREMLNDTLANGNWVPTTANPAFASTEHRPRIPTNTHQTAQNGNQQPLNMQRPQNGPVINNRNAGSNRPPVAQTNHVTFATQPTVIDPSNSNVSPQPPLWNEYDGYEMYRNRYGHRAFGSERDATDNAPVNRNAPPMQADTMSGRSRNATFSQNPMPNNMNPPPREPQRRPTQSHYQSADPNRYGHMALGSERENSFSRNTGPMPYARGRAAPVNQNMPQAAIAAGTPSHFSPFHGMNTFPSPNQSHMTHTPSQVAYHGQQLLQKYMGNRKFDGYDGDYSKTVSLDEFIMLLLQYQKHTHNSDQEVLNHLTPYMTGHAFRWWMNRHQRIFTLAEFERELRIRFVRKPGEPSDVAMEFMNRRQGKDEDLLDYIDEMEKLLLRCPGLFSEWKKIQIIVDNANDLDNRSLMARDYQTLEDLLQFAGYLVRNRPYKPQNRFDRLNKFDKRLERPRSFKRVDALETASHQEDSETEDHETEELSDDSDTAQAIVDAVKALWTQKGRKTDKPPQRGQSSDGKPDQASSIRPKKGNEPIICANCGLWGHASSRCEAPKTLHCYGCGQPGVFRNQCEFCSKPGVEQTSKNDSAGLR